MRKEAEAAKPKCPVEVANKRLDCLDESMDAFRTLERGGRALELKYFKNLNKKTFKWVFDLTKRNMEAITEDWSDEEKKVELKEEDARFLVVIDQETKKPVG